MIELLTEVLGRPLPIRLRAWDGSEAGPADGVPVLLRSPRAFRRLLWSPGELGACRAYVTGEIDLEGDIGESLSRLLSAAGATRGPDSGRSRRAVSVPPVAAVRALALIARLGGVGLPLRAPRSEIRPKGRLHSPRRDSQVVHHHYDLSNEFYSLLLDASMAYSCGYWADDRPGYSLADAQRDKLDLICRKLELCPGARLLDVGCGWGSLTVHAAKEFGASVTAVTVAERQHAFVARRLQLEGVADLVDLRLCDWREALAEGGGAYDAAANIEMGEHVGEEQYPMFVTGLHDSLREGGRLLVQVMSRGARYPGGGPFIERYIAPDMHMRALHHTIRLLQGGGFEVCHVQAMREHYARTIEAWQDELERRWDDAVALIGSERARVWRLYLAGAALSFAENRMGVDQILSVRPDPHGRAFTV